jgi:hypothetical protein
VEIKDIIDKPRRVSPESDLVKMVMATGTSFGI